MNRKSTIDDKIRLYQKQECYIAGQIATRRQQLTEARDRVASERIQRLEVARATIAELKDLLPPSTNILGDVCLLWSRRPLLEAEELLVRRLHHLVRFTIVLVGLLALLIFVSGLPLPLEVILGVILIQILRRIEHKSADLRREAAEQYRRSLDHADRYLRQCEREVQEQRPSPEEWSLHRQIDGLQRSLSMTQQRLNAWQSELAAFEEQERISAFEQALLAELRKSPSSLFLPAQTASAPKPDAASAKGPGVSR